MLKKRSEHGRRAGFSLLELLVVLLIMMVMMAMAVPLLFRTIETYQMEGAARNVASLLSRARYEAQRRNSRVCVSFIPSPTTPGEINYLMNTGPGADPCANPPTQEAGEVTYTLPRNLVLGGPEGSATCPNTTFPNPWAVSIAAKVGANVAPPNFQVNFSPRGFMELPGAAPGTWTMAREAEYFCLVSPPTAGNADTARFAYLFYLEPTGKVRLFQRRGGRWLTTQ